MKKIINQEKFYVLIVTAALCICAGSLIGCSSMQREQINTVNPQTGQTNIAVLPSPAENALSQVMAANAASAPVNPFSGALAILGQVAGAFLAGYGGAHVRIKAGDSGGSAGDALAKTLLAKAAPNN